MDSKRQVSYIDNYRPPHVRGVVNGEGRSPGKEVAEEEEEWSDDSDSYEESSDPSRHRVSHSNSQGYGDFDALQKRMVGRVKTQPALEYAPDTHDRDYDRYWSNDTARASRRQPNMSSNSPGGQTVPYGPPFTTNPFPHYPGQQHNSGPQYYPSHTHHIPPPPQAYPSAYPEVEIIRQELEDLKMEQMENREKERRRMSAKRRAEENRKKKKRAENERRRKAREQEEAEKAYELKIQQMKADYDRKLEILSAAAKQRDQTADFQSILSKILPPQVAGQFGHGCGPGCGHNAQEKQAHDISMIMRKIDSLVASGRQTPPMAWYEQGPPIRYYNDRHSVDDLREQVNDLRQGLGQIISSIYPRQQRPVNRFPDGEYYSFQGPSSSQLPYSLDGTPQLGLPRKTRGGGPRARGRPSSPAVFSGVEEPEPPQTVERRRGNNYPKCEEVDDDNYSDGKDLPPAAMAGNSVDGTQKTRENSSRKRILRAAPREKIEAGENRNAARVEPFSSNRPAMRRTDDEEYDVDTDHSFDASDEMDEFVEERRHRPYIYHLKPDAQFGREVFPARHHPQEPYDDAPRFLPSTSPLKYQ